MISAASAEFMPYLTAAVRFSGSFPMPCTATDSSRPARYTWTMPQCSGRARHRGRSGRARGRRPRRLAALRFPRPQSDRRRRHRRRPAGRPSRHAALVLPDSRRRRTARPRARHRAQRARAPARHDDALRRPRCSSRPACASCCRGVRRVAMEYSPGCAIPYISRVDAGTVELVRAARRRGRVVGRSGPAVLRRSGTRPRSRRTGGRPRSSTASRIARSRRSRAGCASGTPTTEYDIQQLMARLVRGRGARQRFADPNVSAAENAGNPHYLPTATAHRAIRAGRARAARPLGQARSRPARCLPTSRGWATPARRVPDRYAQAFAAVAAARDAAVSLVQQRGGRGPRAARLGSRPRGVVGAARRRLRRSHPAPHGPQPRRVGARQRRQHGRLRDPRRSAAACRRPASRSNRASISTTSASARKST